MCRGTQTEMACGHLLTHITQRCALSEEKGPYLQYTHVKFIPDAPRNWMYPPCKKLDLDAPRDYIDDSCAACDPEFNANRIRRHHQDTHANLHDKLCRSRRAGDLAATRSIMEALDRLSRETNRAVGEARYADYSAVDVEFPQGGGAAMSLPRGTSRWVNGQCVWEDDTKTPSLAPRSSRKKSHGAGTAAQNAGEIIEVTELPDARQQPPKRAPSRRGQSKKEYVLPRAPSAREKTPVPGSARARRGPEYVDPRDNEILVEVHADLEEEAVRKVGKGKRTAPMARSQTEPHLRRSKNHVAGGRADRTSGSANHFAGQSRSSVRVVHSRRKHTTRGGDGQVEEEEEDVWLRIAEGDEFDGRGKKHSLFSFRERMSRR
ncbi:hypothetical protein GGR54DRAFT_647627 [Hypoxylon sp. NC1633]|nr:hypothetical protein GGR54DRAFT_647627 [Hypoxylon sp. NC1633]